MSKFLEDIKEDVGYYYVDEHYDLNDFVMFIAFIFIAVGLAVVEYISILEDDSALNRIIFIITGITFTSPFIAHFVIKTVKILMFKRRKKRCIEMGTMYRGKIVSEVRDKKLFEDNTFVNVKYAFRPVVEYYCNGNNVKEISKYAFSNRYADVLGNAQVTIYKYKNDLIIEDITVAEDKQSNIRNINRANKAWHERNKQKYDKILLASALATVAGWIVVFGVKLLSWYLKLFS